MVIRMKPLDRSVSARPVSSTESKRRVFTTLYWLTCPLLTRKIGKLEADGWVKRFESLSTENPRLSERMNETHTRYAGLRKAAAGKIPMRRLASSRPAIARAISETGIGGVSDTTRVKCLHAHAAYHLVHGDHPLFIETPALLPDTAGCSECSEYADAV